MRIPFGPVITSPLSVMPSGLIAQGSPNALNEKISFSREQLLHLLGQVIV
ncbi:MAG TPA: hypothetical protein VMW89_15200 [Desulfatiglandales bacterium]|nr:hypothetical protein [Desulfatiglandales bacterium]